MYARSAPTIARKSEHEPVALHRGMAYLRPYLASLTPNMVSKEVTTSSTYGLRGSRGRGEGGRKVRAWRPKGAGERAAGCG